MQRDGIPYARAGQVVGLLGGSFDPAHKGHVNITKAALMRFGLDRVWWLVSPANPLKSRGPAPLAVRVAQARLVMQHPRVTVTDIEVHLGTRYTAKTIEALQDYYQGVRFVWLMGADNLAQFHRWQDWREIMARVPVGVLARPDDRISARMSRAARIYREERLSGRAMGLLGQANAPAWAFANLPMSQLSSTAIRETGKWIPSAVVDRPMGGKGF
ncbi:MAG: nicotinate-nucleotide adenylyltransferase [Alteromonas macleodii]|jgi:nicotinate-nucleotide adenylyltransferase